MTRGAVDDPLTPRPPADLRLVPSALLSWGVALLGLVVGWWAAAAAVGLAVAVAVPAWLAGPGGTRYAAGVLAAAGCVAAVGLGVAGQALLVAAHPLRAAAARAAPATVRVVLSGDPEPVLTAASAGYGGRPAGPALLTVRAELVEAGVDGGRWHAGGRLVLLTPVAGWATLLPGTELTASGTLTPALRPDLTVAVLRVRGPPGDVAAAPWWQRAAGAVRAGLREASAVLPDRSAQLLPGLVVGDTSRMSWSLREEFRTTGLTHLVAVSGANVVIIVGAVVGLAALCRSGPRTRVLVGLLVLVGLVILARPSPSVLRAAVMGAIGLLALLSGRGSGTGRALPALAAAVIGLLLLDPALATDPGFALSVLATAALVLLAPDWVAALRARDVPAGVAEALAVPAAAHLVTAPVVAAISGQVSLVAVLANILAAPVVAPVTVLGVLGAALSPLGPAVAQWPVRLAGPGVGWLVEVARRGAAVPDGVVAWPGGVAGMLGLVVVLLVGGVLLRRRPVRLLLLAALLGALLVVVPTRFVTPGWPAPGWVMVACDVGQGDAIALATGRPGDVVLVDTGTETGAVDGCLDRLGVRTVSLVVLTHMHADHIGGLDRALSGRPAGAVAVGPEREPNWAFGQVRVVAGRHRVPVVELRAGQRLRWPSLELMVLGPRFPDGYLDPDDGTDINNTSLVMRASTPAGSVLLCGDAEVRAQTDLLDAAVPLGADVLKLCHHGSRSSSAEFLTQVHPRLVLVSVGAGNPYGHPNPGVLDLLRHQGAQVLRTDLSGDLAVVAATGGPAAVARGDPTPAPRRAR